MTDPQQVVITAISETRSELMILLSSLADLDASPVCTDRHITEIRGAADGIRWRLEALEMYLRRNGKPPIVSNLPLSRLVMEEDA